VNRLIIATTLLSIASISSAFAEEQTKNTNNPETIIVAAARSPITAEQLPTAATILDSDLIDARGSFQLIDIIKDQAGISVARSGGVGGQSQLRMRGGEANHVLVLINGVRANDPAGADELLWEHLMATQVDRIEIIRGPQSALWGSDAMAGVINIITDDGGDGFHASARGEYGSFDTYRLGGSVSGGTERFSFSLGADYVDSAGSNISRNGDENDGYNNVSVSGRAVWTPSDTARVDFFARHMDATNEFDPVDWGTGLPSDGDRLTKTTNTHIGGVLTLDLFKDRLVQKLNIGFTDTDNDNFSGGTASGATAAQVLTFSSQSGITLAPGHVLTLAVDYAETDYHQRGIASIYGDPNHDQTMTNLGFVADYVWEASDRLTLLGSLRHDDNSDFDNVLTWRAGVSYNVTDTTRLRASAGTGQKSPTFTERFGFFADQFLGNPDLKPERSIHYEIGVDQDFAGGAARISLTGFYTELEDEIDGFVFDLDTFLFTAANKDGKSRRMGIELDFEYRPDDHWLISANYAYIKAEEQDFAGDYVPELRRPRHTGSVFVRYEWSGGSMVSLNAGITGDARDVFFPPYPQPSEIVTMDSYVLVSLAAEVPVNEHFSVTGRIENAFDETYEDVFGFVNPGLGAYVGIKSNF
jgi:vitamin B12 transporter